MLLILGKPQDYIPYLVLLAISITTYFLLLYSGALIDPGIAEISSLIVGLAASLVCVVIKYERPSNGRIMRLSYGTTSALALAAAVSTLVSLSAVSYFESHLLSHSTATPPPQLVTILLILTSFLSQFGGLVLITFVEYLIALSLLVDLSLSNLFQVNSIAYMVYILYLIMYSIPLPQDMLPVVGKGTEVLAVSLYALGFRLISKREVSNLKILVATVMPNLLLILFTQVAKGFKI